MRKELKISLASYKIAYSACFIIILSLIRGVAFSVEIGVAMEPAVAFLALVFCSDTYVMEIASKRSEVNRLYPMKKRIISQYKRLMIQIIFLVVISAMGYGAFFVFQNPASGILSYSIGAPWEVNNELFFFVTYMLSIIVTIAFWGILSHILACLFRNMWGGIGCCVLLWFSMNSKAGDLLLGKWNVFSYTYRNVNKLSDFGWLCGKGICVGVSMLCLITLPIIIKKRG